MRLSYGAWVHAQTVKAGRREGEGGESDVVVSVVRVVSGAAGEGD